MRLVLESHVHIDNMQSYRVRLVEMGGEITDWEGLAERFVQASILEAIRKTTGLTVDELQKRADNEGVPLKEFVNGVLNNKYALPELPKKERG